jgi:hypothetical protein
VAVRCQYDTPPPRNEGEAERWEQARRANEGENELGKLEYEVAEVVYYRNELNELDYYANRLLKPITRDRHSTYGDPYLTQSSYYA